MADDPEDDEEEEEHLEGLRPEHIKRVSNAEDVYKITRDFVNEQEFDVDALEEDTKNGQQGSLLMEHLNNSKEE